MHRTNELSPLPLQGIAPGALVRHIGRQLVVALKAMRMSARRAYKRRQERQRMQRALAEMRHLDDRLLRDLGFEPGAFREVGSGDLLDDPRHERARFALSYYDSLR